MAHGTWWCRSSSGVAQQTSWRYSEGLGIMQTLAWPGNREEFFDETDTSIMMVCWPASLIFFSLLCRYSTVSQFSEFQGDKKRKRKI
jgi:hypothetical protein